MMDKNQIMKLLRKDESDTLEFKERPNEALYKTISAFANTKGGTIIIGVNDKKEIVGFDKSNQSLEDLTNRIVNKLSIYPEISPIDVNGKTILILNVPRSSYSVSYEGRYYERLGNTTREMNPEKLQVFMQNKTPWDSITGDFSIDDIDYKTVKRFIELAVKSQRLTNISTKDSIEDILIRLGLITDKKLTNASILLFGKEPQKHFVNLRVRIGRLKNEITIIDDKWIDGNLFNQFEESINIIRNYIGVRYEIKEFQRKDIWEYPLEAIREALLNALVHRNYYDIANFIMIKIYDDHIWFHNPGGLPEGITLDQLKKPHSSVFRNPLIAKVFYLAGLIEQYGSGTVRMVELLKEAGLPEPEFKEETGFSVYFYKDIYTEENLRKMGLNERQIKAVMYVKEKGKITNKEYRVITEVSKPTATRELATIVSMNLFEQQGTTGKGTFYILKKGSQRAQTTHKWLIKGSERQ